MFTQSNQELDESGLDDFIEKPSQNCDNIEIQAGVAKVLIVLDKNPAKLLQIIAGHPFIPGSFLLDDLADKMKSQQCLEKLSILYENNLVGLLEACVYNTHDLDRCVNIMPDYTNKIIETMLKHENLVKRLLSGDNDPEKTLKALNEKYPNAKDAFTQDFQELFNKKPTV